MKLQWHNENGVERAIGHGFGYVIDYSPNYPDRFQLGITFNNDDQPIESDGYIFRDSAKADAVEHHAHICSLLDKAKEEAERNVLHKYLRGPAGKAAAHKIANTPFKFGEVHTGIEAILGGIIPESPRKDA